MTSKQLELVDLGNIWEHTQIVYEGAIEGPPQASDEYTSEQLQDMGMVGLYKLKGTPDPKIVVPKKRINPI